MTDLDLQKAIVKEIEKLTQDQSLKKLNDEVWKDYNIYTQEKPYKDDFADDDQEDYVIVMLDDEDTDEDGNWIVNVHILLSIKLYEEQHQGNLILANLMNQLDLHFWSLRILDNRYEMQKQRHKRFNQECYPNYYECDYITRWKIPAAHQEGIDQLV
ncbi:hypothetical protein [Pseudobutyrivibrio sp.]|uniref:hypothetical protein n=1 Tax=Pseudobutyrivibrio sp. TaxID=2014367 RepID=UPI001D63D624|nr:hypothetical protein [Pseudobutyrivibrio sp.]MBE5910889.1 hypothetical protein [Pseudobutyrivibrio sp.]